MRDKFIVAVLKIAGPEAVVCAQAQRGMKSENRRRVHITMQLPWSAGGLKPNAVGSIVLS